MSQPIKVAVVVVIVFIFVVIDVIVVVTISVDIVVIIVGLPNWVSKSLIIVVVVADPELALKF